ncbi:RDD family protein [Limnofasciculus baicalensis]|uniref:RDD family protein n=1 Tax=Limnofasciculus baicalensis BBK-W-15 TaxID=2699891 RepID=A0AAE3GSN8_9CYAN|nr:RDD family protein [Limnofasciculus baicalensis BBK-W-15]
MGFFNRIKLQTPESVELEFTLAGIGSRAYALLIDYIVWALIWLVFLIAWGFLSIQITDIIESWVGSSSGAQLWLFSIMLLIAFALNVGYFVFFETLWQGQTPGKRYVKIRAIRDDGTPVRLQQATLRALLRPVDDLLFLGVFFIIFGKREKRLGDWVAGTLVVEEERAIVSANFPLSEEAQNLADWLQTEADLSRLLPDNFAVIREYLQRREGMTPEARYELSRRLARQIKDIIALEALPEKVSANVFLESVYLAYQQQSSGY